MLSLYYTLKGLIIAEDKILTQSDKEKLLAYIDKLVFEPGYESRGGLQKMNQEIRERIEEERKILENIQKGLEGIH